MKIGDKSIINPRRGASPIMRVMRGNVLIWERGILPPPFFEATYTDGNNFTNLRWTPAEEVDGFTITGYQIEWTNLRTGESGTFNEDITIAPLFTTHQIGFYCLDEFSYTIRTIANGNVFSPWYTPVTPAITPVIDIPYESFQLEPELLEEHFMPTQFEFSSVYSFWSGDGMNYCIMEGENESGGTGFQIGVRPVLEPYNILKRQGSIWGSGIEYTGGMTRPIHAQINADGTSIIIGTSIRGVTQMSNPSGFGSNMNFSLVTYTEFEYIDSAGYYQNSLYIAPNGVDLFVLRGDDWSVINSGVEPNIPPPWYDNLSKYVYKYTLPSPYTLPTSGKVVREYYIEFTDFDSPYDEYDAIYNMRFGDNGNKVFLYCTNSIVSGYHFLAVAELSTPFDLRTRGSYRYYDNNDGFELIESAYVGAMPLSVEEGECVPLLGTTFTIGEESYVENIILKNA